MKNQSKFILFILAFISIFSLSADGADVEQSNEYDNSTVVKTIDGIRFQVPEDRPIEQGKGFIRPMPLDAYVSMKFSKLDERLQKIEDSIIAIKNDLAAAKEDIRLLKKGDD